MDFSQVKRWTIPEGTVVRVSDSQGNKLWERPSDWYTVFEDTGEFDILKPNCYESYDSSSHQFWQFEHSPHVATKYRISYVSGIDEGGQMTQPIVKDSGTKEFNASGTWTYNVPLSTWDYESYSSEVDMDIQSSSIKFKTDHMYSPDMRDPCFIWIVKIEALSVN